MLNELNSIAIQELEKKVENHQQALKEILETFKLMNDRIHELSIEVYRLKINKEN